MKLPVFAERQYFVSDKPGLVIVARILAPYFDAQRNSWACRFEISNAPKHLAEMEIGGTDSLQALLLGIETFKTHLLNEHLNSKMRFQNSNDTDLHLDVEA